jgi:AcrR family transcriptional regulator
MPKVLPEYLEQRRRQILDAAAACFARRGFHQTTMQDICDQASLSPGAVYRYFRSKDEIIEAMCARGHLEDVEMIRSAMGAEDTQAIFGQLERLFFENLDDQQVCALTLELLAEARRNDFILDSIRRGWQNIREGLSEIVRMAQARGEVRPDLDPEMVARVMMSLYQGLLHQKLVEPDTDVHAYGKVVLSLFDGSFWRGTPPSAGKGGPPKP